MGKGITHVCRLQKSPVVWVPRISVFTNGEVKIVRIDRITVEQTLEDSVIQEVETYVANASIPQ